MYTPRHPVQIDSPTKTASCCFYRQFRTSRETDLRAGYGGYLVRGLAELPDRNGDFAFFFLVLCRRYLDTECQVCVCVCVCANRLCKQVHIQRDRERGRESVCKILPPFRNHRSDSIFVISCAAYIPKYLAPAPRCVAATVSHHNGYEQMGRIPAT